jgi:exopolyphosphatase/guanosine-5'-triphosphate,3'-diphosphate pyrophosphatase
VRRACIDIGSNTTRLLVAECGGPKLLEVYQERSFTRIGRALRHDGRISAEKLDEVARVVAEQRASAIELGALEIRCIATASIRRALNGSELVELVRHQCEGLRVEILSGEDEARLAFLGAARSLDGDPGGPLGVIDVGGGSCELVVGSAPDKVMWWKSLPLGSGEIAADYLDGDPPSDAAFEQARVRIADRLQGVLPPQVTAAVAVGGSSTSLRRLVGPVLDTGAFERSLSLLATERATDVARRFALDIERVRLLPAALLILQAVARRFTAPVAIGRGGIREGVLLEAGA